jgi:DNA invertase Pin-like site-specific DNA recombinase
MPTEAVAYMRCSSKGQIDGDSFDRQSAAIESFCAGAQLEVKHWYREEGVSGKNAIEDRPSFQQMVSELLGNGCRTIVIESLDRLAREYRIQEQLLIYLASKELTLFSANTGENVTEAIMGDPMRKAMVQVQGIFAELDKSLLVNKLRKARQRKKAQTGRGEGVAPFGMLPGEKATLDKINELYKLRNNSDAIASYLNNFDHYNTRSGAPWRGSTIRKILARERTCKVVREKAS